MNSSRDTSDQTTLGGSTLKPYLRRKKSSLGEMKIALVGKQGVGKSALSVRFMTKRFIGEYDQTSETKYKYTTNLDGEQITFEVLDTRSKGGDHGARDDALRWADGFMLVYAVTCWNSFDILRDIHRKIDDSKKAAHIPLVLVGNKSDMAHFRQVSSEDGQKFASEMGCPFLEVSASEDVTSVTDGFLTLCRDIIEYKRRSRTFLDRVFGLKKS